MSIDTSELQAPRHEPQIFSMPRRKPDGKKEPAAEVGFFLQRERENRGLTTDAVSEATGIHPYHIDAIETGDLTHMPPRMEAMEMIAVYAQYLGFEAEPLIEHLFSFLPAPPVAKPSFHPASPPILSSAKILSFGKLPKIPNLKIRLANYPGGSGGAIASVAAALTIFMGASWGLSSHGHSGDAPSAQVAVMAPAQPAADTMATASTTSQPAEIKIADQPLGQVPQVAANNTVAEDADAIGAFLKDEPAPAKPAAVKPKAVKAASAKIQDRIKIEDQLKTASATAAVQIPQPTDGRVYGAENKDAHVVLKATAPVWLRIEDAQGIAIITQMLNTGDTYLVPNRDGLIALSRDGGRIAYSIDGKEKGVLGPPGKILVSEKLDLGALANKKQQVSN